MKPTVGFIGLGLMGKPMALNILKNEFPLVVYNRTSSKTEELQTAGAKVAESPKGVAEVSDIVIIMVTAPEDVEEVVFGNNGIVTANKKDLTVVDMSTIGPTAAIKIAEKLKSSGISFIDAPVTGSTPKAITGELTIFIGGEEAVFEKVKPVLLAMGTTLHYMGKNGTGQAIKLVNNFLVAADTIAVSEAVLLADKMGLSREKVAEALKTATGTSPAMNLALPNFITNEFPAKFSLANLKKDVSLASQEMEKNSLSLPTLKHAKELYDNGMDKNLGSEDFSAIMKIVSKEE